jgi:DHA2 family multidrug resistance protein
VVWERHSEHPVIDISLFRHRNFTVGVLCLSIGFMLYFGTVVLMPLLLQTQMAYTATQAGLAMAPIGILPVLLSPVIGKVAHRADLRWIITASFPGIFALCFYWRTTFNPDMQLQPAWRGRSSCPRGRRWPCFFMPLDGADRPGRAASRTRSPVRPALSNFLRTLFRLRSARRS